MGVSRVYCGSTLITRRTGSINGDGTPMYKESEILGDCQFLPVHKIVKLRLSKEILGNQRTLSVRCIHCKIHKQYT